MVVYLKTLHVIGSPKVQLQFKYLAFDQSIGSSSMFRSLPTFPIVHRNFFGITRESQSSELNHEPWCERSLMSSELGINHGVREGGALFPVHVLFISFLQRVSTE